MILMGRNQNYCSCFASRCDDARLANLTTSPLFRGSQSRTSLRDTPVPIDVLGVSDITNGTLIALLLALTASFLQGRRNSDDFAPSELPKTNTTLSTTSVDDDDTSPQGKLVFDADSWKDMSKPESYVFYNQKLKRKESRSSSPGSQSKSENAWVLIALLGLFVPIFSVEFFFALSRQMICGGDPLNQSDWSAYLCSPATPHIG